MLKIRLARIGRKNDPSFRVVVTEHTRGPKSGNHLEILGNYNPKMDTIVLDGERILHWISQGAQVSDTVHNLLIKKDIIKGKTINVLPKKSPIVKEKEEGEDKEAKSTPAESTDTEAVQEDSATDVTEDAKEDSKEDSKKDTSKDHLSEESKTENVKDEPKQDKEEAK